MKRVLVLNCGSSTFKWSLLDGEDESTVSEGSQAWSDRSRDEQVGAVVQRLGRVDAVGHRVVHGGAVFHDATLMTAQVRADLDALVVLDPLHMQAALAGIDSVSRLLPDTPQVLAFDTAFHANMPEAAAAYGLPFELSERWGLRRFGFHGLSVAHAVQRSEAMLGALPARVVVCHLGGGCSITAVREGCSVDTTMGFTPLEGLMMGTRSGSVDPGLLLHLQLRCGVGAAELSDILTHQSGLLGVSGVSSDLREVIAAADHGETRARLAYERFILSAKHGLGAMVAALAGVDAIVFTGGIGENSPRVRADITQAMRFAEACIDDALNAAATADANIGRADSRVAVLVIRAREDLVILREARRLLAPKG